MTKREVKEVINEAINFGTCYVGFVGERLEKRLRAIEKYARENFLETTYKYVETDNTVECYLVKVVKA